MLKHKIFGLLVVLSFCSIFPRLTMADSADCLDQNLQQFDSVAVLDKSEYVVYAKLNRQSQSARLQSALGNLEDGYCRIIGEVDANSQTWTRLGEITAQPGQAVIFSVSLDDQSASTDASAPALLLQPKQNPPCGDVNACSVNFKNQEFTLQPRKLSLNSDSLRLAEYRTVDDSIREVIYSVDNKPLYKTKELEKFNKNRVGPGQHTLSTTVVMKSGQALKQTEQFKQSDTMASYFLPLYYSQGALVTVLGLILLTSTIVFIGIVIFRRIRAHILWKKTHVIKTKTPTEESATQVSQPSTATTPTVQQAELGEHSKRYKSGEFLALIKQLAYILMVPVVLLVILLGFNSFVIGLFTVDGVSMETTLHDTSKRILWRAPVSINKLNKNSYLPKRGEIVVFKKDENNLFDDEMQTQETYVVKRVIALPGERVVLKNGEISIYQKNSTEPIYPDKNVAWADKIAPSPGMYIDLTLKDGELFMAGDNREESIDSRFYGPIQTDQIIGRVF